jgi:hypothetical protein
MNEFNDLEAEVEKARHDVRTDAYPMSIGELVNLYEDDELEIHPNFQRVFRWTDEQKSKLIESIFLGIPLPSIFVVQRKDGVWDVVDGLQRLSTIFSFMGKLRKENGELEQPLKLQKTKYLPSLQDITWENKHDGARELPQRLKLIFKRQKLDINIIQMESTGDTKFELFQRLNSGGTELSPQELRNCLLIMTNVEAYDFVKELSNDPNFQGSIPITGRQQEQAFYMELVVRYFVQINPISSDLSIHSDMHPFLDDEVVRLFDKDNNFDYEANKKIFEKTFEILFTQLDENAFRKYSDAKGYYEGAFSMSFFEVMATGVANLLRNNIDENIIRARVKEMSTTLSYNTNFQAATKPGVRPLIRFRQLIQLGVSLFNEN